MKIEFKKYRVNTIVSICLFVVINLLAFLFFKYLGNILSLLKLSPFDEIFGQLRNAKIFIPFYIPVIGIILINGLLLPLKMHKVPYIIIFILIMFICFVLTILFAKVNGIRFSKVLFSLVKLLKSGEVEL